LKDIFIFIYFDSHLKISHTNIYLNERVVLCYFIMMFVKYYLKVFMLKHYSLGFYLYVGMFYMQVK